MGDEAASVVTGDSAADYGPLITSNLATVALPSVRLPHMDATDSEAPSNATLPLVAFSDPSSTTSDLGRASGPVHHSRQVSSASFGSAMELSGPGFQRFDLLNQLPRAPGLPSGIASRLTSPRVHGEGPGSEAASPRPGTSPLGSPLTEAAVATLGGGASDAAKLPAWLTDWRLKLALAGPGAYEDLVRQLTLLSAWCYCKCGRLRTSALLYADVAVMLLQRGQVSTAAAGPCGACLQVCCCVYAAVAGAFTTGAGIFAGGCRRPRLMPCTIQITHNSGAPSAPALAPQPRALPVPQVDAACRLLERMMHIVAAEGWHGLLGQLLPKLIACQRLVGHVMLPYTCMRMLALPPEACDPEDRLAVFRELLAVTAQPASRQNDMLVAAIQLQTLQAIQVAPALGSFSRFRGMEDVSGAPMLHPPAWATTPDVSATSQPSGAPLICVGDGLPLHVDVHNALPQAVELSGVQLVLTQLHKGTWLYSGGSNLFAMTQQKGGREGGASRAGSAAIDFSSGSPRLPGSARHPLGAGPDSPKITYQRWQVG